MKRADDLLINMTAALFVAAVMCVCTSIHPTPKADHTYGPAIDVIPGGYAKQGLPLSPAVTLRTRHNGASKRTGPSGVVESHGCKGPRQTRTDIFSF